VINVLQREHWSGQAVLLDTPWQLHKPGCGRAREAVCGLWSHQLGWELRLMIDGSILQRSQVCRSPAEAIATHEQWKAAMVGHGWQ
jgi:hypothetical protein